MCVPACLPVPGLSPRAQPAGRTWWALQTRSRSCLCRKSVTQSGPKV